MESERSTKVHFNAEKFVHFLFEEGVKIPCDDTVKSFHENDNLPPYYNEALYRRGQTFFYDHIFALFYSKFLGLLSLLAMPSIIKILAFTKMSGTAMTAYKRYMSTIFHMCIWYQSDYTPGSKLWQSLMEVKDKHNSVSKRCCSAGLNRINQKDMALTQFGFMGFALAKREKVGLHGISDEEWRAFIHVWKVIGYVMGLEDRFNICRDSVEETTAICRVLADQVIKPAIEKKDKEFITMASYLTEGMWAMNPTLEINIYLNLMYRTLQQTVNGNNNNNIIVNNNSETKELYMPLNFVQRIILNILMFTIWSLQFTICRVYHNQVQVVSLWLMKVFPFLAYYSFGYSNSHVTVLSKDFKMK